MKLNINNHRLLLLTVFVLAASGQVTAENRVNSDYEVARWDPIHFKPAIDSASDGQCLSCHQEILDRRVLQQSPAGVKSVDALAWYQTLSTYEGEQETLHRRHLVTPLARQVMDMKCNTCHQGHDPREEAQIPPDHSNNDFTLRKVVNSQICLMCHGANPYQMMGLPSPWSESRSMFQDDCLLCHSNIRTTRHQVNFLKADAIEEAGKKDSDVCYGCHGGRQWYRIPYPYPRHAWKGMAEEVPDWAKDRPTESEARFQITTTQAAN
jgi:hypothetical protein